MSKFIQRTGYVDNKVMWKSIVADLVANGFKVIAYNGAAPIGSTVPEDFESFVLEATSTVDSLADVQPWRFAGKLTDISTELFAASPSQISDIGEISKRSTFEMGTTKDIPEYAGAIGYPRPKTLPQGLKKEDAAEFFWHKGKKSGYSLLEGTMVYTPEDTLESADLTANPMSYSLTTSDHGFALHISIEGRDADGCRQAWLCIQRPVDAAGVPVTEGKAPLFAIWSTQGGGNKDANTIRENGIRRMTIRESDVSAPAVPVSAVQHSADAFAVINPLQQVPFAEDGKFDFRLPQGFNTHRYSYSYGIDLIGYASADVISNGVPIDVQVYKEESSPDVPKKRRYRAISANSPNNTGMRLFMLEAMDASAV